MNQEIGAGLFLCVGVGCGCPFCLCVVRKFDGVGRFDFVCLFGYYEVVLMKRVDGECGKSKREMLHG